jgi:hypothetical protein
MSSKINMLKAQADFLEHSKKMFREDFANATDAVDAANTSDKINILIAEKKAALEELENEYNRVTSIKDNLNDNTNKTNILYETQTETIKINNDKLGRISRDILSLRRQIEIGEEEFMNKSYFIFFLKNFFVLSLLSILVVLLYKNKNISLDNVKYIEAGLIALFTIIFLYNIYTARYRSRIIFNKMDWPSPQMKIAAEVAPAPAKPVST